MATLNIQVKVNSADAGVYAATGNSHKCMINIRNLFEGLVAGATLGTTYASVSSSDPVAASATVTCASVADSDTVTIGKTTLTAKTSPSGSTQWARGVSNTADAAALAACINANTTLNQIVSATSAAGVVTITANVKGVLGNHIVLSSSSNTTLAVTGSGYLASGAGGVVTTPVTYGR